MHGQIVKGLTHVNPYLMNDWMQTGDIKKVNFGKHNRHMIRQTRYRDKGYDLWGTGEEYSNFSYTTSSLNARDLKIRTAFTLQNTLKALVTHTLAAVLQTFLVLLLYSFR